MEGEVELDSSGRASEQAAQSLVDSAWDQYPDLDDLHTSAAKATLSMYLSTISDFNAISILCVYLIYFTNHLHTSSKIQQNKVMAAKMLQYHSLEPSSQIYKNLVSQPETIQTASVCSGTGASLDMCFCLLDANALTISYITEHNIVTYWTLYDSCYKRCIPLPWHSNPKRQCPHIRRFEQCVAAAARELRSAFGLQSEAGLEVSIAGSIQTQIEKVCSFLACAEGQYSIWGGVCAVQGFLLLFVYGWRRLHVRGVKQNYWLMEIEK